MARIYLSPLIVDIRNKQSDTVFSKWKGINYIRSRVVPHNPKSAAQVAIRDALAELVALWQDCYASVKLNWDEWASGRDYSGFNKFIGKNVLKERDDLLLEITQEVGFTKLTAFDVTEGTGDGELDISFAPTPVPANTDLEVHIRIVSQAGWTKKVTFAAAITSPQTVTGLDTAVNYECYGHLVKDTAPKGEEVGASWADIALSGSP